MMKTIKMTALTAIITVGGLISQGCTVMSYGTYGTSGRSGTYYSDYQNPHWAPPYYQGARYYYIPDIETYFDLATGEFIFLYNGRWSYSSQLPSIYASFDLDNCFTVVLNTGVFQPWRHHQYYISHYPRYYYRDYYDFSGFPYVRGYNENLRRAMYWDEHQRHRSRDWNDRNIREKRNFKYSYEDRRDQDIWREKVSKGTYQPVPDRNNPPRDNTRDRYSNQDRNNGVNPPQDREQRTNYYGKPIGNSVKVTRGMQQPQEKQTRESKVSRDSRDNRNAGTTSNTRTTTKRNARSKTDEKDKDQNSTQKSGGSVYRR